MPLQCNATAQVKNRIMKNAYRAAHRLKYIIYITALVVYRVQHQTARLIAIITAKTRRAT